MYEIWFNRIEASQQLKRCQRHHLEVLAVACLEHALMQQHAYYQADVPAEILAEICSRVRDLWRALSDSSIVEECIERQAALENRVEAFVMNTDVLVHGFLATISALTDATGYISNPHCSRGEAIEAMGDAYFAVAQESMQDYLSEHPLPSGTAFFAALVGIDENVPKCMAEIEYQETVIDAVLSGKALSSNLPPEW